MTYFLQFIVGLIIAGKLGPYYFGIYGFIQLILNYFGNVNLGINHSLNVYLVHNKKDNAESINYIVNAIVITLFMAFFVFLIYIYLKTFPPSSFERYQVDSCLIWICIIAVLQYFNNIFVTVLRINNHLNVISFIQSIQVVLYLICVLLFTGVDLINSLIVSMMLSNIISIILAYKFGAIPNGKISVISISYIKGLLYKGLFLFLYNSCFAFITISNRTIISSFYSVDTFGKFTFSYQLANALISLSSAMSFVIFPKLIDRLSSTDMSVVEGTIDAVNNVYVSFTHMLMYIAIPFFALFVLFLPQYSDALTAMNLISLAVLMNVNTTAFSSMLIARDKEKLCAAISILGLILNVILGLILVKVFSVNFAFVILATMASYIFICMTMSYYAYKLMRDISWRKAIFGALPLRLLIPLLLAISITVLRVEYLMFVPLIVYLLMNFKNIQNIYRNYIVRIIKKPQMVDLEK